MAHGRGKLIETKFWQDALPQAIVLSYSRSTGGDAKEDDQEDRGNQEGNGLSHTIFQ